MEAEKIVPFQQGDLKPANEWPDDGEYFLFAWKLSEALYRTDFTKVQHRLIHYIIRKTWGWRKKTYIFNLKKAADEMGLPKQHVWKAYHELIKADVFKTDRGEIGINKYSEQWNLEFLRECISNASNRRKSTVTDAVTTDTRNGHGYETVTDAVTTVTDTVTDTGCKAASDVDLPDAYIHLLTDKGTDNPLTPPKGGGWDPLYRFEDWYRIYPKKKQRGAAERAWTKLTKTKDFGDDFVDLLIKATLNQRDNDPEWIKQGGQFVPNPATWLNGKGWLNEIATAPQDDFWDARRFQQ